MSDTTLTLSERMAKLRETSNTNPRSELYGTPTHIFTLLEIYNKASHDCYIDYMQGFQLLVDWLCPTKKQLILGCPYKLVKVPRLAQGYDQSEISRILCIKKGVSINHPEYLECTKEIQAIIFTYCAKSIPKDYLY